MFIAMNRFKVRPDATEEFEAVWKARDTHLTGVRGFVEFHLLRGAEHEGHVLYASHTVWATKGDFEAWTVSEEFRMAHSHAPGARPLYLSHPQFEGFESIHTVHRAQPVHSAAN